MDEAPADPDPAGGVDVVRLRLDVGYDGTDYSGWARQPGRRTVQDTLESALGVVLGTPPPALTVAGRTDAGVHARGQVCHVDVPEPVLARVGPDRLVHRIRNVLPDDLLVRRAAVVSREFDARFAALSRRYAYRVCTDIAELDPVHRRDVLVWRRPLDVALMNAAAPALTGEHDFAAFCRRRPGASTVRRVFELEWTSAGPQLTCRVIADAFCHQMVRSIVGSLVIVGEARRRPSWVQAVLEGGKRDPGVLVLPPRGLTLEEVHYPPPHLLAARVAETRARRPGLGADDRQSSSLRERGQ